MELHFPVISSQCSYLELAGGGYLRQVEVKRVFFCFSFKMNSERLTLKLCVWQFT